jgi:hypothetical protein
MSTQRRIGKAIESALGTGTDIWQAQKEWQLTKEKEERAAQENEALNLYRRMLAREALAKAVEQETLTRDWPKFIGAFENYGRGDTYQDWSSNAFPRSPFYVPGADVADAPDNLEPLLTGETRERTEIPPLRYSPQTGETPPTPPGTPEPTVSFQGTAPPTPVQRRTQGSGPSEFRGRMDPSSLRQSYQFGGRQPLDRPFTVTPRPTLPPGSGPDTSGESPSPEQVYPSDAVFRGVSEVPPQGSILPPHVPHDVVLRLRMNRRGFQPGQIIGMPFGDPQTQMLLNDAINRQNIQTGIDAVPWQQWMAEVSGAGGTQSREVPGLGGQNIRLTQTPGSLARQAHEAGGTLSEQMPFQPFQQQLIAESRTSLAALDNVTGAFQNMLDAAKTGQPISIGPWNGRLSQLRGAFIGDHPEANALRASLNQFRNAVINNLSGAAVSEQEMERMEGQLPTEYDPPLVFTAKLIAAEQAAKNAIQATSLGVSLYEWEQMYSNSPYHGITAENIEQIMQDMIQQEDPRGYATPLPPGL